MGHVQALETMMKFESVNGYAQMLLNRLPNIGSDLVRDDKKWQEWILPDLVKSLQKWTDQNPISTSTHKTLLPSKERKQGWYKQQAYQYRTRRL